VADKAGTLLSVTCTVKLELVRELGVPTITPVLGFKLNPAGKLPPAIDHVYGSWPPCAINLAEYDTSVMPYGRNVFATIEVTRDGNRIWNRDESLTKGGNPCKPMD